MQFAKESEAGLACFRAVNRGATAGDTARRRRFGVRCTSRYGQISTWIARYVDLNGPGRRARPDEQKVRSMRLTLEAAIINGDATFIHSCLSTG